MNEGLPFTPDEAADLLKLAPRWDEVLITGTWVHNRKGEPCYRDVTGEPNHSYGNEHDPIEIRIEFTVENHEPAYRRIKQAATQFKREALERDVKTKTLAAREAAAALDKFNAENHNP